jgi:hypothetical protein
LLKNIPGKYKSAFAKFRCGVAPLKIETGRYECILTENIICFLSLVRLLAHIVLLGTSLVSTKLKGERMECNIGQDVIRIILRRLSALSL